MRTHAQTNERTNAQTHVHAEHTHIHACVRTSAQAKTVVELVELKASSFHRVLVNFPGVESKILEAKERRERETAAAQALIHKLDCNRCQRASCQDKASESSFFSRRSLSNPLSSVGSSLNARAVSMKRTVSSVCRKNHEVIPSA